MKQSFTIPYKPNSVNSHWRTSKTGGQYLSKEGKEFRENVRAYIKLFKYKTYENNVKVKLDLYFSDNRRRDLDNYFKSIIDCFNGILYLDDKQIYKIEATKHTNAKENYFCIEIEEVL